MKRITIIPLVTGVNMFASRQTIVHFIFPEFIPALGIPGTNNYFKDIIK